MMKRVLRLSLVLVVIMVPVLLCIGPVSRACDRQIMAQQTFRTKIILDPGHGGIDGGAIGVDGLVEKDINLEIALTLRSMLEASGFEVLMTRETDISIHDPSAKTIKQQKTSDLKNRLKMTQENPDAIFVSIHQNQFPQGKYKGAQVFYGRKNEQSKVLAELVQATMIEQLDHTNKRKCKEGGKELYLLYESEVPTVLVECGFVSNPEEAALLATEEYRKKVAFSIYSSLMKYTETSLGYQNTTYLLENKAEDV
ncbi:MAG TPA: N-acetylmuramoyl-L-alanine amidase CwlD [Firmicutes bacterium]|nr:N-acetylmuramoyl-L-alanine amidase CwlD [Bacillota bacterium]